MTAKLPITATADAAATAVKSATGAPARARLMRRLATALPSSSIRWLLASGMLLVAVIVVAVAAMIFQFRERALANTERELQDAALMVSRHVDQQFLQVQLVQERVAETVRDKAAVARGPFVKQVSDADFHRWLRAEIDGLPCVRSLRFIDRTGKVLATSRVMPAPEVNESEQEYFRALTSDPELRVVISKPAYDKATGSWTLVLAQKVLADHGELLGIVAATIQLTHFEDFFSLISRREASSIALFRSDSMLLVRYPRIDDAIGGTFNSLNLGKRGNVTLRFLAKMDGKDRILTARPLPHFPLYLTVGLETEAALQDWRDQSRFLVIAGTLSALLFIGLIFLVMRQLSREHAQSSQRLAEQKERLDVAVDNMTQGLLVFDAKERLIVRNQRYLDMFGLSADVIKPGCPFRELMAVRKSMGTFAGDVDEYCTAYVRRIQDGTVWKSLAVTTDGRSIQIASQPLAGGGWVATLEDITEQKRSAEKIAYLAHYDSLTDLPNRVLFREKLHLMLRNLSRGEQLAVLYLDLDKFKDINDTLGHPAGDEMLTIIAGRLRSRIKKTDVVARLGGDEFAIIQTRVEHRDDVVALAQRVTDAIRAPMVVEGHELTVDTSIGIAVAPLDGVESDQLLKNADLALHGVKADGRRAFRFFEPEMDARIKARRQLEVDLRQAIEKNELELHYQPLASLRDGTISCLEALLRWHHPQRGMISPADFIPIAEEGGLINALGDWVLRTACAEAANWPGDVRVAVNVSPLQFRNEGLALSVAIALAASGLPARRLELEITEAVLMRDDETALRVLGQLQQLGVRIALDDFGTGYSSLSYLQRFPFDKIKIDRTFINDVAESDGSLPIVQAIVAIAQARNMATTAEGVETEAQLKTLRATACTEMQGYLFCRPTPASRLAELFGKVDSSGLFAA